MKESFTKESFSSISMKYDQNISKYWLWTIFFYIYYHCLTLIFEIYIYKKTSNTNRKESIVKFSRNFCFPMILNFLESKSSVRSLNKKFHANNNKIINYHMIIMHHTYCRNILHKLYYKFKSTFMDDFSFIFDGYESFK